ncbi:cold-shock protein [Amycolatopsis sp. EV170708-02-1]|uniref:cold-shock protein n=1 Tax=Amycolatopsis sp. EV170708-02-1 TaxID=2919322 RepID=UPI001F0C0B0E|nr:cold shock domain-containing protein [Amycolatopsis sp. EV170708-02-1]UMP06989.1 cold shock domain-containing protein [Amycolatopsis sp. EV170708-02-1]
MDTGTVIRFDEVRGYGFVSSDLGGDDLFIHVNDLEIDKRLIVPGVQVEFVTEEGDRGLKASRVRLSGKPSAAAPPVSATAQAEADPADGPDDLCDVLTVGQLTSELTESLLATVHSLTAQQILAVRECVVVLARGHGWIDE